MQCNNINDWKKISLNHIDKTLEKEKLDAVKHLYKYCHEEI